MHQYDKERFEFFNSVLTVCSLEEKTTEELRSIRPVGSRYDIKKLLKNLVSGGYLQIEKRKGTNYYRSLKTEMKLSEYVPYPAHTIAYLDRKHIAKIRTEPEEDKPYLRKIILEKNKDLMNKNIEADKLRRQQRSAFKVHIGSQFGMV